MVVPLQRTVNRRGLGSLCGKLILNPDWDSAETNNAITSDFGLT